MGSLASSAMLCVVTGGREFRFRANTRRFRRILSSLERRSSALGTSVPCSLDVSLDERSEERRGSSLVVLDQVKRNEWIARERYGR
jgi:hypothetical protein